MKSMTGYGSASASSDGREITVELKSVNHRFLDFNLHIPRVLTFAEDALRKAIAETVVRGHVEVNVTYRNTREDAKELAVDTGLIERYREAFGTISAMGFENNVRLTDVIRLPDVITILPAQDDQDAVLSLLVQAAREAARELDRTRCAEGEKIGRDLQIKLQNIRTLAKQIEELSASNAQDYAQRLNKRLEELLGDNRLDEQRLHQEVAIFADRIAIDEELVRLDTHIQNMSDYMNLPGEIGKKLDFFIQELNREVNTIGSKSAQADIAKLVVAAKCEIEKLREQVQNIE